MKIISQHRAPVAIAALVAITAIAAMGLAAAAARAVPGPLASEWLWSPATEVVEAVPPLPPTSTFPVQLVLDDDSSDGAVGVAGQTARQFLWFNRFSAGVSFQLEEVWVLFPSGANMTAGAAIQIAIYEDPDGDPANGANLIASFNDTIQAADDNTFSLYTVPFAPVIPAGRDLLIGVVPRFIVSGVTPPTLPAALDTTASQSRSWLAAWTTDPPDPPVLVPLPDQTLTLVDDFFPGGGNFMIRAFGTPLGVAEIPALDGFGLAALALALLAAGVVLLRHRSRRSRGGVGAALSLLLLAFAAPAGAVTVDTFTTNQAVLSDPPGGNSSALGGADIIGTRRGMVVDNLLGAGPTTSSVAAGNLVLLVTATTPDSRGEARLSWDGDALPLVLNPTGLANANLTSGNASGFRLDFVSTTVVAELEITVYEDAANFSRVARRVAVGGVQSVSIPFAEFRVAGGAGADFASVGAIEMTVRSDEGTVTLSEVTTTAPTIAATKVDAQIVDTDGDTRVDPGDRVRYTVTVTNTGNQALAVNLTDTIDANTTLVAGSVSSTPVAHNDQYGWFGNVTFSADGTPFPTLLANDADADGDDVDVQVGTFPAATAEGGSVTLVDAETGEFTYAPPAGFKGIDSFLYTIEDGDAHTATATAYIHLEGIVWFVDNGCTVGCGQGTLTSPFTTLPAAEAPSGENDIIYIRTGIASYDTGPANGFTMDVDEQLLGEGVALILGGTTIVPAGTAPTLTNNDGTPGRGLTLASTGAGTDTVRGLTIGATTSAKIFGSAFGTLATDTITLNGVGQALDLSNGVLAATFASITSGSSGLSGISLQQVSGTLTATGGTSINNSTTQGIFVNQSTVNADFGTTSVTGTGTDRISLQNNSGGTRTFATLTTSGGTGVGFLHAVGGGTTTVTGATSITNPGGIGISIASSTTAVSFAGTTINKGASSGTGLSITGSSGTTSFSNLAVTTNAGTGILMTGSPLSLAGTGSTVAATGGPALDLTTVNLGAGATFASASSTGSTGKGMNLDTLTGPLTMNGGAIATPGGIAFDLNAGAANVTYAGSISNVANAILVDITSRTGGTVTLSGNLSSITLGNGINVSSNTGGTINFSGATKTLSTVADTAVTLATNTGTTINFTGGGLDIDTTTGTGFNATGGATGITVQGTGNSVATTTGTGLNVANTTIGAGNLVFQSISTGTAASGPVNGIALSATGSSGRLQITGTGSAGSGGTIQRSSGAGALLMTTSNVSLSFLNVINGLDDGIHGESVSGLDLTGCAITGNGNSTSDDGLQLGLASGSVIGVTGTLNITNTNITGNAHNGVHIRNTSGTLDAMNVSGSTFNDVNDTFGANAFLFEMSGTAVTTAASITASTFSNNTPQRALEVQAHDTGRIGSTSVPVSYFTVSGNVFTNNGIHASFTQDGSANLAFRFLNNGTLASPMTGTILQAVNVFSSSQATGGTIVATISGNHINNGAVSAPGISAVIQGQTDATLLMDGNRIRSTPDSRGLAVAFRGPANPLAGTLGPNSVISDITLTNNDVDTGPAPSGFPLCAIVLEADNQTLADNKSPTVRADIRGNVVPASGCFDLLSTQIAYYEYDGAGSHGIGQLVDTPPASADATAQLTSTNTGSASAFGVALIAGPINTPP